MLATTEHTIYFIYSQFHGNPSSSQNISLEAKNVKLTVVLEERSTTHQGQ